MLELPLEELNAENLKSYNIAVRMANRRRGAFLKKIGTSFDDLKVTMFLKAKEKQSENKTILGKYLYLNSVRSYFCHNKLNGRRVQNFCDIVDEDGSRDNLINKIQAKEETKAELPQEVVDAFNSVTVKPFPNISWLDFALKLINEDGKNYGLPEKDFKRLKNAFIRHILPKVRKKLGVKANSARLLLGCRASKGDRKQMLVGAIRKAYKRIGSNDIAFGRITNWNNYTPKTLQEYLDILDSFCNDGICVKHIETIKQRNVIKYRFNKDWLENEGR